jgi:hypothetical protein
MAPRKLILFFNTFFGQWPETSHLPCIEDCEFTTDRGRLRDADAVIFHLPTLTAGDDVPKLPGQQWVAWSMESTITCPALADPAVLRQFDLTMTYQQDADIWLTYFGGDDATTLLAPPPPKPATAPIVYFQSHRYDRSGRTRYAAELMKRVKIDSYGKVLHNKTVPPPDEGSVTALQVTARYKFALAFENSIAPDYVTEKFFNPLRAGTVPIYLGAPNVDEFAPGEGCFINVADFAGPAELAAYVNHLNEDDDAYRGYFSWKDNGLAERFRSRLKTVERHFLCRLCDRIGRRNVHGRAHGAA